ncbi:hypothetical protein CBS101457_001688 [Exobasidium rhododendri]|nr:hypothetical protein CBS101457_001688 [Exobasidium rhododendri]
MGPNRGRGKGKAREPGFAHDTDAESHAERAAQLLAKARASSSSSTPVARSAAPAAPAVSKEVIALPALIKSLVNPQLGADAMTIKEAIPVAGKLTRGKLNTPEKLSFLNTLLLEEAGITSEGDIHKILIAFGVRKVGTSKGVEKSKAKGALEALSAKPAPSVKKRKIMDDDALSREYGNINAPVNEPGEGELTEYIFNEILEEDVIKSRRAVINRAPIMTAWAIIVLEKEGFLRREALSLG